MKRAASKQKSVLVVVVLAAAGLVGMGARSAGAIPRRRKQRHGVSANDPTSRLYQTLNSSMSGKLDIYMLADLYTDPSNSGQQDQHVLHVVYDKTLFFGRFAIHVRSVSKLTPQQLSTYSPKQIFDFAASDMSEFEKIDSGRFGKTGDLYLLASDNHPPAPAPITESIQREYNMFLTGYVIPAVEKQQTAGKQ